MSGLKYNMPMSVLQMFEQWKEDHLIVVRLVGDVELNGTPIFEPLPYGRWVVLPGQDDAPMLVTLTYYPPFAVGVDDSGGSATHLLLRSTKEITDEIIEKCTQRCITAGQMTYKEWTEKYPDCDDSHLKTVKIK